MAKNLSERGAFDATSSRKPRLAARQQTSAPERDIYQCNCLIDSSLKIPLQIARAKEGKSTGEIIEPLLRDYLATGGYLS